MEASTGTLHFANERKNAVQATRSTPTRSASAGLSRSASTASRSGASGSGQPPKKRKRRKKKKTRLVIFAGVCLVIALLLLGGAIFLVDYLACGGRERCEGAEPAITDQTAAPDTTAAPAELNDAVITPNVTIDGVSVQNLTVAEARQKLESTVAQHSSAVAITVSYEDYSLTLRADDLGLDYSESLDDALLLAAQSETPQALRLTPAIDSQTLRNSLQALNEQIPSHAVNAIAEVKYKTNEVGGTKYYQPYWDYTEGVNGAKIDADALEQQIVDALNAGNLSAALTPTVAVSEPEVTVDSLKSQLSLLGSYSTWYYYKGSSSTDPALVENRMGRDVNITKAIGMMQVVELKAGKSFSFNKTTGDRTEKKGWALANAIQDQTYTKEPGGGVCQVSTTIFNAILRSGITDINRRGHSIPSDYVTSDFEKGLGFDATVDSGHIDFSFKNNTGHTIYMFIYISKNKDSSRRKNINVEIYGQKQEGVEYRCRNEILEFTPWDADESRYEYEVDKTMLASAKPVQIRKPHDGYKVKTYVDKYVNGTLSKTVYTEETTYKVIYPKYKIGSAVITPAPTNTPKATATPKPEDLPEEEP